MFQSKNSPEQIGILHQRKSHTQVGQTNVTRTAEGIPSRYNITHRAVSLPFYFTENKEESVGFCLKKICLPWRRGFFHVRFCVYVSIHLIIFQLFPQNLTDITVKKETGLKTLLRSDPSYWWALKYLFNSQKPTK